MPETSRGPFVPESSGTGQARERLVYLHSGSIPSVYANDVHVMRMCDAFTEAGHEVTLYALPGSVHADDVYDYYGGRHRFPIRTIGAPTRNAVLGMGIRGTIEPGGGWSADCSGLAPSSGS